ncbi:MAG: hypothetical protein AB1306_09305 [Nitrospirota bacterium]
MDAETLKPLNNAIVYLQLDYTCYFPPNPAGPNSESLGNIEVKTDNNGNFYLPLKVYLLPPLLCFTGKYFTYAKAGYFNKSDETNSGNISLFRMNHYLNYLPYKSKQSFFLSSDFEEKSNLFKPELEKLKKVVLEPIDSNGTFLRLPGKKITKIYSRSMDQPASRPDNTIYYAYDDIAKDWITFDSRGKILEFKRNGPNWDFMSTAISWGWPLYASHDSIFYPIDENPMPVGTQYKKGDLKYIPVKIGNISTLVGYSNKFFTIEDDGNAMCPYGSFSHLKCFTGNDLPVSTEDDTIKNSVFKYAVDTLNHGMFVVTQSKRAWHVYKFGNSYDAKTDRVGFGFAEIYAFPIEKEITAFTATGNEFFVAFNKDGLKRYDIILRQGFNVKEDTMFALNAQMTRDINITSLIYSRAVNVPALYATTGKDKIYRFSMDGIPDYIVKQ